MTCNTVYPDKNNGSWARNEYRFLPSKDTWTVLKLTVDVSSVELFTAV